MLYTFQSKPVDIYILNAVHFQSKPIEMYIYTLFTSRSQDNMKDCL